jgi:dipeptidyl-peptidase-4
MKRILLPLFIISTFFSFAQLKELTLKDAVMLQGRSLAPERITNFQWIANTSNYSYLSKNWQSLYKSDVVSKTETEIANIADVNLATGAKFQGFIGLTWLDENQFTLNDGSTLLTYNLLTKKGNILQTLPENAENGQFHPSLNHVAFTIENNLWIQKAGEKATAITNFTDKNIVSGQTIARNEFGISQGIFWSPNGAFLAFYQKNETNVHDYPLLDIDSTPGSLTSIKYPMAGQKSEEPKLGIYNLSNNSTIYISPRGAKDDYLTNVCFTPDNKYVLIAEVNRGQNHCWLNVYDVNTGAFVKTILEEKNDKWIEPEHTPFFPLATSNNFIWVSERSGFNNLFFYDFNTNAVTQLTNHNFVIKEILSANKDGNMIYYKATGENPTNTVVYVLDRKKAKTTLLTPQEGTHNFAINQAGNYFYDAFSSGSVAHYAQISTLAGKQQKLLIESKDKLAEYKLGTSEIGKIKGKDGSDLYYRMIKPSNFDASKKYPVLVYVYGGPHAQMVTNSWLNGANLWMHWMAEQGYLVFTLDNRGSAERGFAFESQIHRQLGNVEMEDQLSGVEFLKSLAYVDANRLAVHGWSFGGFMTTSLMLRHPDVFKVGVAGGPVTDWKYYEIMYGERYMDQPEENPKGYEQASLLNHAGNLKGDLLLIHGTIDDVVVMQHNYALVKKFVDLGIQMDFFPYPMHKHNVTGKDRVHLIEKVLNYVIENNK